MLLDEEKSNCQRFQDQVNALNSKVRSLKRDKEEVEGELETSKSRMRMLKSQLEEAEETSSSLQTQIIKLRTANRRKMATPDVDEETK
jgi:chromosome segregation ATPase